MEKKVKSTLGIIATELFSVSLVTYLILLLLETLDKGFVSDFFNLNYLLAVVLVSGIIMVSPLAERKNLSMWELIDFNLFELFKLPKRTKITENDFYFVLLVSLGGGALVYFKTSDLGILAAVIAFITSLIILLLSYLILTEDEESNSV